MERPTPSLAARACAGLIALLLALAPGTAGAARGPYEDGERIRITGLVTDPAGRPIPQLHVVLEASRSTFNFRRFAREKKDLTRLTDLTDDRGEYTLEWPWNSYYNTFELVVGIPVRRADGEKLKVLERVELTRRIQKGSPVVSAVVVANADFVTDLRQFLATIQTEDEHRIHQQAGKPDRVERVRYPDHVEVSWWYFESGKVYRFRDGKLLQIDPFEPVKDF